MSLTSQREFKVHKYRPLDQLIHNALVILFIYLFIYLAYYENRTVYTLECSQSLKKMTQQRRQNVTHVT